MAIKRTIKSATPMNTAQIKAPNLNKTIVGVKKNEQTIIPEEEVIEVVESVSVENPTPFIPEIDIPDTIFGMPIVDIPERGFEETEKEPKLAKEKRFAKIALCLGVVVLVLMILNKK